jgi:alpha-L-fucosidase
MGQEINFTPATKMKKGYPKITKLGAVSPYGESTPFVFNNRVYRLELKDPTKGLDVNAPTFALIRDRETGEILSQFGEGCYYYSLYQEAGTVFVIGVKLQPPRHAGDTFWIYESQDLRTWKARELLSNPGWSYYNTSLTKGPDGYVLLMEAGEPREYVGEHPFTLFFATSPDMIHWTFMDYDRCFSKERYNGGPWMRYSNGWYYVISVTEMPCYRFTNYIYRTKDFETWEVGIYNPILMPSEEDRKISPYFYDLTPEFIEEIRDGFISNNSDIDMCDWNGKTLISYNAGNQLGFYYMAEAEYDGTVDQFLAACFDE